MLSSKNSGESQTTHASPVHQALQDALGDLSRWDQELCAARIRKFLRALPNDGQPIPVTGVLYQGGRTNYNPVDLAAYAERFPK